MNYLWPIIIIISFLFAVISGNIQNLNNSIFSSLSDVVKLSLTLVGNMCLWCGIMKIIQETKTPAGLKAMEELQKDNKNKEELSNAMIMLIVLNTTSIQLIPTTVIAIRSALRSPNPSNIIVPIWISTIAGTLTGVIITKILLRRRKI